MSDLSAFGENGSYNEDSIRLSADSVGISLDALSNQILDRNKIEKEVKLFNESASVMDKYPLNHCVVAEKRSESSFEITIPTNSGNAPVDNDAINNEKQKVMLPVIPSESKETIEPIESPIDENPKYSKAKIDEICEATINKLDKFVRKKGKNKERSKAHQGFLVSSNIHGKIDENKSIKSLGVYKKNSFNVFIFTITKDYEIICEIYSMNFDIDFIDAIQDLLWMTNYLYFYNILEVDMIKFFNIWKNLKLGIRNNNNNNQLKSITFTPYSFTGVLSYQFSKDTYNTIYA